MKSERIKFGKALIFVVLFAMLAFVSIGCASAATIYVPDNHTKIQWAVDNASAGNIIRVHSGTYYENVNVTKQLTLQGVDTSGGKPVVDAGGSGSVFTLNADGVVIEGFTVRNAESSWKEGGIKVTSSNNIITGNNISNNHYGIFLDESCNNVITGNNISNNDEGISLYYSSNNNTITGNEFVNDGLFVFDSYHNTVEKNTVNSKPLVYLEGESDLVVGNAGQVVLVSCDNISIENQVLSYADVGIELWETENSTISNNIISNNNYDGISLWHFSDNNIIRSNDIRNNDGGIVLWYSSGNNIVTGNDISNNYWNGIAIGFSNNNNITNNNISNNNDYYGIYLHSSSGNTIYNNKFDNTNNAFDEGNNIWNITKTGGTNIIGGPYLGGNYWSDYVGEDLDGDELGDTLLPYNSFGDIVNGGDYLPLSSGVTPPPKVNIRSNQNFMEVKYIANGTFSSSPSDIVYEMELKIEALGQFTVPKVVIFNTTPINVDRTHYKVDDVHLGRGNIATFPDRIEWTGNNETVSSEFVLRVIKLDTHELTPPFSASRSVTKEVFEGNETITMSFNATPTAQLNQLRIRAFAEETNDALSELLEETATNPEFISKLSSDEITWSFYNPHIEETYSASVNLTVIPKTALKTRYLPYSRVGAHYGSYVNFTSGLDQSLVEYSDLILGQVQIHFETPVDYSLKANGKGVYHGFFRGFSEIVEGCEPNTIGIHENAFKPGVRKVPLGTTVEWTNREDLVHTVTSDTGLWDSGNLSRGQSFSYTFTEPGTYSYHDALHPSVKGMVIVLSAYTKTDVGVTSNITLASPNDLATYLPPEYSEIDISDSVVLNVNVTDTTPGNSTDDAYTDITINVGELDVETCEVYKEGSGFLPEVDDVATLPTVKPPGEAKFSRDVANNSVIVRLYVGDPLLGVIPPLFEGVFDTGKGTYPSIMGTHEGTITPNKTIIVHKMYTYPCAGTGGHTEYVSFYGAGLDVNKTWNGYIGDYHYIIFDPPITLQANTTYDYEIRTGSYPQIIHERSLPTLNGTINCTQFTDANGKIYTDWIPAIRLE